MNIEKIREDFPFLKNTINGKPLIYFDNAATTQKPRQVLETINNYYSRYNAAINRSIHDSGNTASAMYAEAHENAARFIGARSFREIVFTRNSTEAVNLVGYSLIQSKDKSVRLGPGDEVIVTVSEHHSNFVPWQRLAEIAGVLFKIAPVTADGFADPDGIKPLLSQKTRLICCPHVSNVLGVINPVKDIARLAHDANAFFLVDATQSVPHLPVDADDIGCDFLTFSGHKMLAPLGTGALYGRKELLEKMPPFLSGGGMIKEVSREHSSWNELPWKFEAGTPDVCGAVALAGASDPRSGERLSGAMDYLSGIGMDAVHDHERDLCGYAVNLLKELDGVVIYGSSDLEKRCGIISFNIKKDGELVDSHIIARFLDAEGIAVRSGGHCAYPLMKEMCMEGSVRISFYLYNTRDEIDRFIEILRDIINNKLL